MDVDIIENNTLISSLTDVQFNISRLYNENGETYATLTVMRKSRGVEIRVLTLKDISKLKEKDIVNKRRK